METNISCVPEVAPRNQVRAGSPVLSSIESNQPMSKSSFIKEMIEYTDKIDKEWKDSSVRAFSPLQSSPREPPERSASPFLPFTPFQSTPEGSVSLSLTSSSHQSSSEQNAQQQSRSHTPRLSPSSNASTSKHSFPAIAFNGSDETIDLFTPDLIQDALAVIYFPERVDNEDELWFLDRVHRHLQDWGSKQLLDAIRGRKINELIRTMGEAQMDDLETLELFHHWIKTFAIDYLYKARQKNLRCAYFYLPVWSTLNNNPDRLQAESKTLLDILSPRERRRLVKSFLRREMLSKYFRLRSKNPHNGLARWKAPLTMFSWNVLDQYEGRQSSMQEIEGIKCVFEYFRCMYGALYTRTLTPDRDARYVAKHEARQGFQEISTDSFHDPHNFEVDATKSMRFWPYDCWNDQEVHVDPNSFMDHLGLEPSPLLSQLLMSDEDMLYEFFCDAPGAQESDGLFHGFSLFKYGRYETVETELFTHLVHPRLGTTKPRYQKVCASLISMYRQRAWAIFNDAGLYNFEFRPPTFREIMRDVENERVRQQRQQAEGSRQEAEQKWWELERRRRWELHQQRGRKMKENGARRELRDDRRRRRALRAAIRRVR